MCTGASKRRAPHLICMSTNVAILGLGIMGAALARSAARGGLQVTGWDRSAERASTVSSDNIRIAQNPRQAVEQAEVVVTMVSDAAAVLSIMKDHEGLAAMRPGAAWIQMS